VAVSPDGQLIASGSRNDALRVWNPQGKQLHALNGLRDIITDIAFSPDGTLFAAADAPGEIMIWNANGTVRTNVFKAHQGYLSQVAFSPDATVLASGGADTLVKLWSIDGSPSGEPLRGHQSLAFAATGAVLASGSADGTVRIWNVAARDARTIFIGIGVDQVGFLRDLLWVRANGETLLLYDADLRLRATFLIRRDGVLDYTPDGWLAGSGDATRALRLYRADGSTLSDSEVSARLAPDRVRAALGM
jgi:WD40 repeat protein